MKRTFLTPVVLFYFVCMTVFLSGYGLMTSGCFGQKSTETDTRRSSTAPVSDAENPSKNESQRQTESQQSPVVELPVRLQLSLVARHPHDTKAFAQGLEFYKGELFESTGHYGQSTLRRVEIATGKPLQKISLPRQYFGEGITPFNDKIYQLTWQEKNCFVYDRETFQREKTFSYPGEGWGLTNDGTHLIMSDGTSRIRFLNPENFQLVRTIEVRDGDKRVTQINELEYIRGEIWANMLGSKYIVRINPTDGRVIGWINCTNFFPKEIPPNDPERVLNGIAWDAENKRIYITGKDWPVLYELQLEDGK